MLPEKRILIVDDDAQMAEYIAELLHEQGYQTDWAFDGEEAIEKLHGGPTDIGSPFDLMILDVMIPGIDGYEVCRRIKRDDALRHISVIMVTGLGSTSNKTKGLELGADDYVTKPFTPEELLARVKAMLRVRAMEQEVLRRNRELQVLNHISRLTSSSLDLNRVLQTTLNQTMGLMAGRAALIALMEPEEECAVLRMHRGLPPQLDGQLAGASWSPGEGVIGQVIRSGEIQVADDLGVDPHLAPLSEHGLQSMVCVPLLAKGGVVGALAVIGQKGTVWGEHSVRLLEAVGGQVGTAIENARLYTRVRDYAEALARSQAQLVQAEKLAAMGRLTASIAHELNNPLQAIQNCLHLVLHRSLDDEKRSRYLKMAQEEVERLIVTVQRMLDFYRPSPMQLRATDVHQVLEDVLALAGKQIQRARVRVRRRFAANIPPLNAVKNQLKQVFLNLVINAVEAMPNGGDLEIETRLVDGGQWVAISFRDHGVGLSKEAMAHLFEPFYTTKSKGTGLGLSISYGIIEQHGGTIEVQSTTGRGSCFTVRLPARPLHLPDYARTEGRR